MTERINRRLKNKPFFGTKGQLIDLIELIYFGYREIPKKHVKGCFFMRCFWGSSWYGEGSWSASSIGGIKQFTVQQCKFSITKYELQSESFLNCKTDDSSLRILEFLSFSRSNDLTPSRDKKNHPMISNIGGLFFHQAFFFIQKLISL